MWKGISNKKRKCEEGQDYFVQSPFNEEEGFNRRGVVEVFKMDMETSNQLVVAFNNLILKRPSKKEPNSANKRQKKMKG